MSLRLQKVRIELHSPVGTRVWVDDVEQQQIRTLEVSHDAGGLPVLVLKTLHFEGEIVGEAAVKRVHVCPTCGDALRNSIVVESTTLDDASGWETKAAVR